jgi:hypothetical protein
MKGRIFVLTSVFLGMIAASSSVFAQDKFSNQTCPIFDAVYSAVSNKNDKIHFEMRIVDNAMEGFPIERGAFFVFSAFDTSTQTKLSSLRLANTCSPHYSECWADAKYGQYASIDSEEWENFKSPLFFDVISLDKEYEARGDLPPII